MTSTSGGALVRGLVAGAIGAWSMDRVTWLMLDRASRNAIERERAARPEGLDVSHGLARELVARVHVRPSGA